MNAPRMFGALAKRSLTMKKFWFWKSESRRFLLGTCLFWVVELLEMKNPATNAIILVSKVHIW